MPSRLGWMWLGFVLAASAAPAWAATFNVSPVRVDLSAAKMTGVLSVTNAGDAPTVVQCQVLRWSQRDGQDLYTATDDLIATPPIFTLVPGKTQIVRVGLREPPSAPQEIPYRIYLQEIPPPPKPGFQGLQFALRIGVPVFVLPAQPVSAIQQWQASLASGGTLAISLHNAGTAHVQVFDFRVSRPGDAQPLAMERVAAYVLPGQSMRWTLSPARRALEVGERLHLRAYTDAGNVDTDLVLGSP